MNNKKALGNSILVVTAMIWGMAFAFQKEGMDHIGPLSFAMSRLVLSILAALVMIAVRRAAGRAPVYAGPEEAAKARSAEIRGGVLCGTFLATASLLQQVAIVRASAGKAGFITALYVVLVPVMGTLVFRKSTGILQWLAVAVGTAGLYLLCVKGEFRLSPEDTLLILCALAFSFQILFCDRYVADADPIRMSLVQFITALAISAAFAFAFETPRISDMIAAGRAIAYCGLISGGLGYSFQMIGQRYADPVAASLILAAESVFSVIGGWILLGEMLSARELLGCCVMFAAIVLSQIPQKRG